MKKTQTLKDFIAQNPNVDFLAEIKKIYDSVPPKKPKFSLLNVLRSVALFLFDLTSIIAFCCIFLSGLLIVWGPDTAQAGKIFISVMIFNIFLWFWASVFDR